MIRLGGESFPSPTSRLSRVETMPIFELVCSVALLINMALAIGPAELLGELFPSDPSQPPWNEHPLEYKKTKGLLQEVDGLSNKELFRECMSITVIIDRHQILVSCASRTDKGLEASMAEQRLASIRV